MRYCLRLNVAIGIAQKPVLCYTLSIKKNTPNVAGQRKKVRKKHSPIYQKKTLERQSKKSAQ